MFLHQRRNTPVNIEDSLTNPGVDSLGPNHAFPTTSPASANGHTLSTPASIALAVVISVVLLTLVLTGVYLIWFRKRSPSQEQKSSHGEEMEVDEDGVKIEMKKMEREQRGRWWSRKDGVKSQDTLVEGGLSVPAGAVVRGEGR